MAESIYLGRANHIKRKLTKNGSELTDAEKSAITKVQVIIQGVCFDSEADSEISYSDGVFDLQAGLRTLEPKENEIAYIFVFDADHSTDGLAWGTFRVQILDYPTCE